MKKEGAVKKIKISDLYSSVCVRVGAFIRNSHMRAVSLFDSSLTSYLMKNLRDYVPYIQNRIIGAFLLTFGVYSALISIFKCVFDFGGNVSDVYSAVCISLVAVPLIFSKGTLATMLMWSEAGQVFSEAVGIRLQILGGKKAHGKTNIAFLAGMILGTLTFIWSPLYVIGFVIALAVLGVVFTYPEASVLFLAVILPFGKSGIFELLMLVGTVAFLLKIFRGKRSLTYHHHRAAALIFLMLTLLGGILAGNIKYAAMMLVYFLVSSADGYSMRAEKAAAAAVISCGCVSSVGVLLYSVERFGMAEAKNIEFDNSGLLLMCCALMVLAASFVINRTAMPRKTAMLCMLSMVLLLVAYERYMYIVVSVICIILLLFFYRRRASYAVFAVMSVAYAAWVWLGGSNRKAFDAIRGFMKDFELGDDGIVGYIISGSGLENGFVKGDNFYGAVASKLGIIGLVVLVASVVLLVGFILRRKNGKGEDRSSIIYMRAWAPACAAIALLACGFGVNIWLYDSIYVLFWLLAGVSSAIASDSEVKCKRAKMLESPEMTKHQAEITI